MQSRGLPCVLTASLRSPLEIHFTRAMLENMNSLGQDEVVIHERVSRVRCW